MRFDGPLEIIEVTAFRKYRKLPSKTEVGMGLGPSYTETKKHIRMMLGVCLEQINTGLTFAYVHECDCRRPSTRSHNCSSCKIRRLSKGTRKGRDVE